MAQRIIEENAGIQSVTYSLPNKHYIPVDMKYIGVDNLTPLSIFLLLFPPSRQVSCFLWIFHSQPPKSAHSYLTLTACKLRMPREANFINRPP